MTPTQRDIDAATMWWLVNHEGEPPHNLVMAFARHGYGTTPASLQVIEHPMASASVVEIMDYLALRLAEEQADNDDDRRLVNAIDRFDECYMWTVAWLSSLGIELAAPETPPTEGEKS